MSESAYGSRSRTQSQERRSETNAMSHACDTPEPNRNYCAGLPHSPAMLLTLIACPGCSCNLFLSLAAIAVVPGGSAEPYLFATSRILSSPQRKEWQAISRNQLPVCGK